jgi:hypothetical protein
MGTTSRKEGSLMALQFAEFTVEGGKASLFKGVKVVSVVEYPRTITYPKRTVITHVVHGSPRELIALDSYAEVMSRLAALDAMPADPGEGSEIPAKTVVAYRHEEDGDV